MTEPLKPCPFCGRAADFPDLWIGRINPAYSASCRGCHVDLGYFQTRAEAIAAWNRRAPVPVPDAAREADKRIGFWLSAALEDPKVSDDMKADINNWFDHSCLWPGPEALKALKEGGGW